MKNIRCQDGHLWCWSKNRCAVMWCQTAREGQVVVEAVDVEDDFLGAGLHSAVEEFRAQYEAGLFTRLSVRRDWI